MIKHLTCIECPQGCRITVETESGWAVKISGQRCDTGERYAKGEIEDPRRLLTAGVLAEGLVLKVVPVRTDRPIPKGRLLEAMEAVRKITIDKPVRVGDVITDNFMEPGVRLIATRDVGKNEEE